VSNLKHHINKQQIEKILCERYGYEYVVPLPKATRRKIRDIKRGKMSLQAMRDNGVCAKCGARSKLTIDHIHERQSGGTYDEENLQLLCKYCHREKNFLWLVYRRYVGAIHRETSYWLNDLFLKDKWNVVAQNSHSSEYPTPNNIRRVILDDRIVYSNEKYLWYEMPKSSSIQ
jgi:HNH endonuclease